MAPPASVPTALRYLPPPMTSATAFPGPLSAPLSAPSIPSPVRTAPARPAVCCAPRVPSQAPLRPRQGLIAPRQRPPPPPPGSASPRQSRLGPVRRGAAAAGWASPRPLAGRAGTASLASPGPAPAPPLEPQVSGLGTGHQPQAVQLCPLGPATGTGLLPTEPRRRGPQALLGGGVVLRSSGPSDPRKRHQSCLQGFFS